jgi:polysaccharide export outer membrane protein
MQRSATTIRSGVLALLLALFFSPFVWRANAQDQNTATAPTTTKPTVDVAKAQPSSPDTATQRVAPVKPDSYIIGAEDVLSITVWKEPEMSHQVPVRPDGMISLPLLGDIKAAGLTPLQLQDQLTNDMKKYISDPQVTVIVNQVNSLNFNVVGEVLKPGYYPLTRRMTILDAIAISGGFRDFAKIKKIYVLRTQADGKQVRIPFNYKNVIKGKDPQQNIELQPHDTLVVP